MKIHLSITYYFMRKFFLAMAGVIFSLSLFAQNHSTTTKKKQTIDLSNRANDHFMIQLGDVGWFGRPDTISVKGLSKSINVYLMYDFPFKTNPHYSVAVGVGIGSDNMFFNKTYIGIKDLTPSIDFANQTDTTHFKKSKLSTNYVEAPIELRYAFDPMHNDKSFKIALGIKVGALINAHTRSKTLQNSAGSTLNNYVEKEASKRFFNGNRLVVTGRVGWGHFGLYYSYQLGTLFKNLMGPVIHPYTFGVTLSGL